MARRIIPLNTYLATVDAFRQHGINFAAVARVVGLDRRAVTSLYSRGLPAAKNRRQPGLPAISRILAGEAIAPMPEPEPARASVSNGGWVAPIAVAPTPEPAAVEALPESAPVEQSEIEVPDAVTPVTPVTQRSDDAPIPSAPQLAPEPTAAAPTPEPVEFIPPATPALAVPLPLTQADLAQHAQEALTSELRAIAAVRDGAIGAAVSSRKLLAALQPRIDRMASEVLDLNRCGVPVDPVQLSKTLHRILLVAEKASQITEQVIKSERLALGSPTEIIKVASTTSPAVDSDVEATKRAQRVLDFLAGRRKNRTPQIEAQTPDAGDLADVEFGGDVDDDNTEEEAREI